MWGEVYSIEDTYTLSLYNNQLTEVPVGRNLFIEDTDSTEFISNHSQVRYHPDR